MTEQKKGRLHFAYYRNGDNHRGGADVSFGDIVKIFGFRGVEIGRWVTKQEQQIAANLFFDALADLMDILDIPEKVISLNGTLAINFGIGGRKGAFAHYNSATRTLALAKNAGGGALAHEWFHSFDHFITNRFLTNSSPQDFASERWLQSANVINHPLNQCLEDCYRHIFLKPNSTNLSLLFAKSVAADKALKGYYYSRPQEVCARAFEACIEDNPLANAFLVKGTKHSTEAKLGVYPQGNERRLIAQYFLRYFSVLGKALKNQPANTVNTH